MLHSFYYSATQKAFNDVAAEDPSCAIAAWGYASILIANPLQGVGATPDGAKQAQDAIEKGREMGAKTRRERDYLEAVGADYKDFANHSERERQVARAKAYEALAAQYPDDDEAQIFYALYLAATQLPVRSVLFRVSESRRHPREGVRQVSRASRDCALPNP